MIKGNAGRVGHSLQLRHLLTDIVLSTEVPKSHCLHKNWYHANQTIMVAAGVTLTMLSTTSNFMVLSQMVVSPILHQQVYLQHVPPHGIVGAVSVQVAAL